MIRDDVTPLNGTRIAAVPAPRAAPGVLGPEPPRRTRPLSEYWDVEAARWTTRSPVPAPRRSE